VAGVGVQAAELVVGQGDVLLAEHLAQVERGAHGRGLDVGQAVAVVDVQRAHQLGGRVDPDTGSHGNRLPVDDDVEVGGVVLRGALACAGVMPAARVAAFGSAALGHGVSPVPALPATDAASPGADTVA
jgi:hypothetical protein